MLEETAVPKDAGGVLCPVPSYPHLAAGSAKFCILGQALMKSLETSDCVPELQVHPQEVARWASVFLAEK